MNTGSTREQVDLKRLILIDKKIDKLLLTVLCDAVAPVFYKL